MDEADSCLARNRPVQQPAAEPLGSDTHYEKNRVGKERGEYSLLAQSSVGEHFDADILASSALLAAEVARGRSREAVLRVNINLWEIYLKFINPSSSKGRIVKRKRELLQYPAYAWQMADVALVIGLFFCYRS